MEDLRALKMIAALMLISVFMIGSAAAWGNVEVHPKINEIAYDKFLQDRMISDQYLKNCSLDGKETKGDAWDPDMGIPLGIEDVTSGKITYKSEERSKDIRGWIISGGFSADEPEAPQALRHFYDPIREPHYLTDVINDLPWVHKYNPRTSALDWAFNDTDNNANKFSFPMAKKYFREALAMEDAPHNIRYGNSWRAVGETMHLLSDMTVPAHVRDDCHIPFHWKTRDPYEAYTTAEDVEIYGRSYSPTSSLDYSRTYPGKTGIRDLMIETALWTNQHFLSRDTVPIYDSESTANGMLKYSLPEIEIDPAYKGYYYVDVDGRQIPVARQSLLAGFLGKYPDLVLDAAVWTNDSRILIPTAVEVSVSVLDAFLPRFVAKIDEVIDEAKVDSSADSSKAPSESGMKVVKGHLEHIPTLEWPDSSELAVKNGAYLKVIDKDGKKTTWEIKCPEGGSLNDVKWSGQLKPGDELTLEYDLGGYRIRSEPYKLEQDKQEQNKPEPNIAPDQGCGEYDYSTLEERWDSGLQAQYYVDKNGTRVGLYQSYYDDEKKHPKERGCHGPVTYDEYGLPVSRENGLWTRWYESGNKESEGYIKDNLNNGHWITWYENGSIKEESDWVDGKVTHQTKWYENGNKESEWDFANGKTTSMRTWYEDGSKKDEWVANGRSVSYYKNGNKMEEGNCKDGVKVGHWTYWYEGGTLRYEEDY